MRVAEVMPVASVDLAPRRRAVNAHHPCTPSPVNRDHRPEAPGVWALAAMGEPVRRHRIGCRWRSASMFAAGTPARRSSSALAAASENR